MNPLSIFQENWLKSFVEKRKRRKEEMEKIRNTEEKIKRELDRFYHYAKNGAHSYAITSIRNANSLANTIGKKIYDYIPLEELRKRILDSYRVYNEKVIEICINDFRSEKKSYLGKVWDLRFASQLSKKIGKSLTDYITLDEIRDGILNAFYQRLENSIYERIKEFKNNKLSKYNRIWAIRSASAYAKRLNKSLTDYISIEEIRSYLLNIDYDDIERRFMEEVSKFKNNIYDLYYLKEKEFEKIKELSEKLNKRWQDYVSEYEAEEILKKSREYTYDTIIKYRLERFKSDYYPYEQSIQEIRKAYNESKEINKSLLDYISREEIKSIILKKRQEKNKL